MLKALVAKALDRVRLVFARHPRSDRLALLRAHLETPAPAMPGAPRLAIQGVEDPLYFGLFNAIALQLRKTRGAAGELVVVRSINGAIGVGAKAAFWRSRLIGGLLSAQWIRAWRPWVERIAYRSLSFGSPFLDLIDRRRSRAIWHAQRRNGGSFGVVIDGVPVTDLVIDSYLRFRPAPRFDAADPFVLTLLRQAHRDVRRARAYFARQRPAAYLTSYATYIEHGIAVRVALDAGVRVFSFGSLSQFGKELTAADTLHTPDTTHYRSTFERLADRPAALRQAAAQLEFRLSGGIDPAMSYMRAAAYGQSVEAAPEALRGATVIFLHDFYDSPHVYHDLVFDDFWQWVTFTIETLREAGVPFFIKPHPNQIALSGEALQTLRDAYPALRLLSPRLTNTQLVEAGIACGVTMYGSVAHELAYYGVPTIACARHPHHAFDFCRTARSREAYRDLLRTPDVLPVPKDEMQRQALAFFYMHNLQGSTDALELRNLFNAWWKASESRETTDGELLERLRALRTSAAFERFCDGLLPAEAARSVAATTPARVDAHEPSAASLESMER